MALDPYRVLVVKPDWPRVREDMGSKRKFWCRAPDPDGRLWLFKAPRSGTGEHWAEKIAAEIAAALDVMHAQVELARSGTDCGSATKSFARQRPRALYHGNQLLARVFSGYDPEKTFKNSSHTLENIWQALDRIFRVASRQAKRRLAEYTVLDALVGNTDRHHENWGLLRRFVGGRWKWFVAPSYDHASSLGRELSDAHRDTLLAEGGVGRYSEKARGGIYWSEADRRAPSPLKLVRRAYGRYPELFAAALKKVEVFDDDAICRVVARVPCRWMTPSSRVFAVALMRYNLARLREVGR